MLKLELMFEFELKSSNKYKLELMFILPGQTTLNMIFVSFASGYKS